MKFDKNGVAIIHKPKTLRSIVMGSFSNRSSFTIAEITAIYMANLER